jgi:hypothetical protein
LQRRLVLAWGQVVLEEMVEMEEKVVEMEEKVVEMDLPLDQLVHLVHLVLVRV